MTETFDSYKLMIKNLQGKIKELREENLKLEEKLVNALSAHSLDYRLTIFEPSDKQNIYDLIKNFIETSKNMLIIVSRSISSDILDLILKNVDKIENLTVITTKRNQIYGEESIESFDTLASTTKINHIINSNLNSSFIIKDNKEILLISGILKKSELISKLNIGLYFSDPQIVKKFVKFYKEHLPSFMK